MWQYSQLTQVLLSTGGSFGLHWRLLPPNHHGRTQQETEHRKQLKVEFRYLSSYPAPAFSAAACTTSHSHRSLSSPQTLVPHFQELCSYKSPVLIFEMIYVYVSFLFFQSLPREPPSTTIKTSATDMDHGFCLGPFSITIIKYLKLHNFIGSRGLLSS